MTCRCQLMRLLIVRLQAGVDSLEVEQLEERAGMLRGPLRRLPAIISQWPK
jgi:hypothetical protein